MSDASSFGFGKFIPGFDFLQGLAQSAGSATARSQAGSASRGSSIRARSPS